MSIIRLWDLNTNIIHRFIQYRQHRKNTYLVLDGGGVQHGYIFHSDALPDQALASANRNKPLVDVHHKTKLF